MTSFALATKFPFMHLVIVFLMARVAELGSVFVLLVNMALVALHFLVFAQQGELGFVVIELGCLPIFLAVTLRTVGTQFAFMSLFIVLLVAGHASLGRVFVFAIDMAFIAFHIEVLAQQFKVGLAVIEVCRLPIFFDVAFRAVRT